MNNEFGALDMNTLDEMCCAYRNVDFREYNELECIKAFFEFEDDIYKLYKHHPEDLKEMKTIIKELKQLNNVTLL